MTDSMPPRLSANDLDAYWMPFTANRLYKSAPRVMVSAKGMYYTKADGGQVLDGASGLWCVNAGHGREEIAEAISAQARQLDYAPAFQMGHPGVFDLASRLTSLLPGDLDHVFFVNSGSEAVETALKIALATHRLRGEPGRTRLIGRQRGYHGVCFGGLSVGGIPGNSDPFSLALPGTDHLPHTHDLEKNAFSRGQPESGGDLAQALEDMVAQYGADTIAAVIVEPMAGSTGVLIPPKGYLERLRTICDRHGILLIFDEVITGFGRLGAPFAADLFGVTPDIMTLAKGLTNGAVPMGAVGVKKHIYESFMGADLPELAIELPHGFTYSGHPLACTAALATLDIYAKEDLFARSQELAPYWEEAVHSLKNLPFVIDIRNLGLVAGIELEPIADRPGARAFEIYLRCFEAGLLIRTTADIIALSPPLIIEPGEIDRLIDTLSSALKSLA